MTTIDNFSIGFNRRGIGAGALGASGITGHASPRGSACAGIVGMQMRAWAFVAGGDR